VLEEGELDQGRHDISHVLQVLAELGVDVPEYVREVGLVGEGRRARDGAGLLAVQPFPAVGVLNAWLSKIVHFSVPAHEATTAELVQLPADGHVVRGGVAVAAGEVPGLAVLAQVPRAPTAAAD